LILPPWGRWQREALTEGHGGAERNYRVGHCVNVFENFSSRKTDNLDVLRRKKCVATLIAFPAFAKIMRLSVDLDIQSPLRAIKIHHDALSIGMLSTKLQTVWALLKNFPKQHLRQSHFPAKPLCVLERFG
jgi:hypothetical protein